MYRRLFIALCVLTLPTTYATDLKETKSISTVFETGELTMDKFLEACPNISKATPSKRIQPGIVVEVVNYNGQSYEIRTISFENTQGKVPAEMTFHEYATKNNLLTMKSNIVHPQPSIAFECFDFRHAKLNDGVYFTIVLRKIDK